MTYCLALFAKQISIQLLLLENSFPAARMKRITEKLFPFRKLQTENASIIQINKTDIS